MTVQEVIDVLEKLPPHIHVHLFARNPLAPAIFVAQSWVNTNVGEVEIAIIADRTLHDGKLPKGD